MYNIINYMPNYEDNIKYTRNTKDKKQQKTHDLYGKFSSRCIRQMEAIKEKSTVKYRS